MNEAVERGNSILDALEENCRDASAVSAELLMELIRDNKDTEFGRAHGFSDIKSPEDYKKNVPFSDYDDYAGAVERMTRGEKNVLTAYPVVLYALTTGSVGTSKKIPVTDRAMDMYADYGALLHQAVYDRWLRGRTGGAYESGKSIFMPVASASETEDGTTLSNFSGKVYYSLKDSLTAKIAGPPECLYDCGEADHLYLKAFYGLKERNVTFIGSAFTAAIYDFFVYIENNWQALCGDIAKGRLDPNKEIPEEVRRRLDHELEPDPERARELAAIFEKGFDRPVVSQIWKNFAYMNGIGAGSFAVYTKMLRRFTGDIPFSFSLLCASEGLFATTTRLESLDYVLIPDAGYIEFIAEEDMELPEEELRGRTLECDRLEPGKNYEMVITNLSGLYRYRIGDVVRVSGYEGRSPKLCFQYRRSQVLNVAGEKTSEDLLRHAVDAFAGRKELKIEGWSVYEDHSVSPGRYVIFIETDPVISAGDRLACRDILEEELAAANEFYREYIGDGHLAPMKLLCLQPQTYSLYRELMIYKGASPNQMKPVHMIDDTFKKGFFFALTADREEGK